MNWEAVGLLHVHREEATMVDLPSTYDTIEESISQRKIAVKLPERALRLYIGEGLIS